VPHLLVDLVAVLALVVLLAVAFGHPRGPVEAAAGVAGAAVVLATGSVGWHGAWEQTRLLLPVVVFLSAVLVVAELCAAEGVFTAVGGLVAHAGRGSGVRMLGLTFVAAAVTTAVLSLDATVVLLTSVVATAAVGASVRERPVVHACARLANSASLLLPVSNLTNLLAVPRLPLSFLGFAGLMAPVWLVVIAVEYVGHRWYFRADLRARRPADGAVEEAELPVVPLVVVGLMLAGFAGLSPLGVAPAWVAVVAAVVLGGYTAARRRMRPVAMLRAAHLPFAVFVLGLGVVVAGLAHSFLGDLVASVLPDGTGLAALLLVALVATVLANLVNNLPATLLLVPLVAPLGTTAVLAALVGLGAGSGLSYTGSLANLLWRRSLLRYGSRPSAVEFHRLALLVTPPAVALGVVVLWGWSRLVR
jgi:arsenical pump membrane protein